MDISLVLATYRRPEILHRTLSSFTSLSCHSLKWDVWVVDNANDKKTKTVVKSFAPKLPINYLVEIKTGKNNALNHAISVAQGKLIVFTDDDIIATSNWLTAMWQGMLNWPDYEVFGGRILPDWPKGFSPPDMGNPLFAGAYAIANWDISEGEYSSNQIFGPNMAVRRKIFDEGWRFDSNVGPTPHKNYKMGSETEFINRLVEAGKCPIYLPESLVYHQIRAEQMVFKWLKQRAIRAGIGSAFLGSKLDLTKNIIGVPRYLFRQTIEAYFKYLYSFFFKPINKIEYGMRLYTFWGMIKGYRMRHHELTTQASNSPPKKK